MFERFTEKAIKVIMLAQEEARRLGHNFVGTEQILLGLIGEASGDGHTFSDSCIGAQFVFPRVCNLACRNEVRLVKVLEDDADLRVAHHGCISLADRIPHLGNGHPFGVQLWHSLQCNKAIRLHTHGLIELWGKGEADFQHVTLA